MRGILLGALVCCALFASITTLQRYGLLAGDITFGLFSNTEQTQHNILFTGDVFLGRAVERWQNAIATETPFTYIDSLLQQYQTTVLNFESALPARHIPTPDYTFSFSVPVSVLPMLAEHNVSHVSLANNHSYDYGRAGYQHAITAFATAGIETIGDPQSVHASNTVTTVSFGDAKASIVALNTIGVTVNPEDLVSLVQAQTTDFVIVYIHWGEEYQREAGTAQVALATTLAEAGADIIVGHHPHVVQPVSRIDDTLVFYSLGNTVFDQYFDPYVQEGLLLGLGYQNGTPGVRLYPVTSAASKHQPQLQTTAEREQALVDLAAMSDLSLQTAIRNGFIPLQ